MLVGMLERHSASARGGLAKFFSRKIFVRASRFATLARAARWRPNLWFESFSQREKRSTARVERLSPGGEGGIRTLETA